MQKILIAIDYAPSAQKVTEQGYALGKAMHCDILLLHVIEDVGYYSSTIYDPIMGFGGFTNSAFLEKDIYENIQKEAQNFLEHIKEHLKDATIQTKVLHGNIADGIIETATSEQCDLVVIGTHSRSHLEEILLGSTAHQLIRHSKIPIYIIPNKMV